MSNFQISHTLLANLCRRNRFPVAQELMIFLGIRGSLPVFPENHAFATTHDLMLSSTDHQHPRCTLVQWLPAQGLLAVFPGSTVPHLKYIRKAMTRGGAGANQMLTGYYADYRKGDHNLSSPPTRHRAFRQMEARYVLRTLDDEVYEADDRMEFNNPFDNLHAAWSMGVNHADFASAGCQVVVGYPKCTRRGGSPDSGPWASFVRNAYAQTQDHFPYALLTGQDYYRAAAGTFDASDYRLRYGSVGEEVRLLQQRLKAKRFYEGIVDDKFGSRTMNAVLAFQRSAFGVDAADGIVGPVTLSAL
ncbi:peptidoglycan-binding domain-containing protein [Pontibacter pamirensis]|uniref:peptidoglycan-binding domain-containing protein n=1 Tax=Pontibacter pamirensis TaxID=2562824 RepID=UPI00138986FA|nr:peptidoglycan-binding domain-containing protein [Pontibacter pamirensis]